MLPDRPTSLRKPVEYAPTSAAQERHATISRNTKRVLMLALASVVVAWGWRFARQAQYLYWQHQCMTYTMPANTFAYDRSFAPTPACFANLLPERAYSGYAFLHARRTKSGAEKLVAVSVSGQQAGLVLIASSFAPATLKPKSLVSHEITKLGWLNDPDPTTRVRGGAIDPKDESHFTIATIEAGKPQTYDGWLKDDGQVVIEARHP